MTPIDDVQEIAVMNLETVMSSAMRTSVAYSSALSTARQQTRSRRGAGLSAPHQRLQSHPDHRLVARWGDNRLAAVPLPVVWNFSLGCNCVAPTATSISASCSGLRRVMRDDSSATSARSKQPCAKWGRHCL